VPADRLADDMDLTIAICTWNRATRLDRTLAQLCRVHVPDGLKWELLVVENNCTDETPAVIASYANRLPIRRLVEPALGVSNARNCALEAAQGELLLFTDDDIIIDEDWIAAYLSAANRWPDAGFFGGVIEPHYEREPPAWFRAHEAILGPYVGEAHNLGADERRLTPREWPWGGNMAFRRVAYQTTRFSANLGRRGNDRSAGGELAYCRALLNAGFEGVWVPAAKVKHLVGADRLTLSFIRRNFVGQGITDVRLSVDTADVTLLFGVPRWLILSTAKLHVRYLWRRVIGNPAWLITFMDAARNRGAVTEYWRQSREKP
jgi:glucosyl-dolichyl phosphate glucuronosyltransferase